MSDVPSETDDQLSAPQSGQKGESSAERRPPAQENWRAMIAGVKASRAFEVPLFTDARITGMITEGFGPYQFFNTVPLAEDFHVARPAIVLRFAMNLTYEPPRRWDETSDETYHAGGLEDEVAAILSLCLGIRARAGGVNREFGSEGAAGDPRGLPISYLSSGREPMLPPPGRGKLLPSAGGGHSLDLLAPFLSFPDLPGPMAVALVRSARLYQAAMWVAESDPNQSWILFSSAVETAAGQWSESTNSPLESLSAWHPSLVKLLRKRGGETLAGEVAEKLNKISGATWKFLQFLNRFRPDPPELRPGPHWELDWSPLPFETALKKVYHYRSRALHGGTPFPGPMCWPVMSGAHGVPAEVHVGSSGTGLHNWTKDDLPLTLHLFEYLVRRSLLAWWQSYTTDVTPAGAQAGLDR